MAEEKPNVPKSYILENSGDNNTTEFEKDDILSEIRDDTVDYARQEFKDGKNKTQLKLGSQIVSLRGSDGNPAALTEDGGAEQTYTQMLYEEGSENAVAQLNNSSNSQLLEYQVAKGKVQNGNPDVDDLYNDINSNLGESNLSKDIDRVQKENNIYSESDLYISKNQTVEENDSNVGNARLQIGIGKHGPKKWPEAVDFESNIEFKIEKLKNLGIQVLMNSSGEIKAAIPEDPNSVGDVLKAQLASTVPGAARLGVKVPINRFSAAEVAKDIVPGFEKTSRFPELKQETRFSYGSVNNQLVPFSSVSNTSSRAAAMLLAATISGMLKALAVVLEPPDVGLEAVTEKIKSLGSTVAGGDTDEITPKSEVRKEYLGSYYPKSQRKNVNGAGLGPVSTITSLGSRDIITRTKNNYQECIRVGLEVFFGAPSGPAANLQAVVGGGAVGGNLLGEATSGQPAFDPVRQNPEYFSILLRFLVRATTEDVLGAVGSTAEALGADLEGRTPSPLDIDRTPGLDNNPTNLLNVIQDLKDSKLVKFLNIIASIGDLCIEIKPIEEDGSLLTSKIDSISDNIDGNVINPAALIKKHRLSDKVWKRYEDKLSWGADTIQSMYMSPSNLFIAEKLWYGNVDSNKIKTLVAADKNYRNPDTNQATSRLSAEMVTEIENFLDGYYMPFYFHDLRTNEIIAFHAFIENVSDSYDADYQESEGFGRIGRTQIYKNTNRQISLSFRVVSTGPEDFNSMWFKINKLVMLMYPQYTKGRQLTFEKGKFIQPFSQLVGNSPMIRLRVGDLIKSNYSEFDLARLFGVGTENYKMDDDAVVDVDGVLIDKETLEKIREGVNRMVSYDFDQGDKFTLSQFGAAEGRDPAITYTNGGGAGGSVGAIASNIGQSAAGNILPAGIGNEDDNLLPPLPVNLYVTVEEKIAERVYILSINENNVGVKSIRVDFNKTTHALGIDPDYEYLQSKTGAGSLLGDLSADAIASATAALTSPSVGGGSGTASEVTTTTFLGSENPIFKAFETTKGEGLAGFIKSINFDWSDSLWSTEGLNNRAPMWCKIDIDFTPVHDINPGLDSSGAPIGMPYNVGTILKKMKLNRNQSFNNEKQSQYISQTSQAAIPSSKKTNK